MAFKTDYRMKKALLALSISIFSGHLFAGDFFSAYQAAKANDAKYAQAKASLEVARERLPQGRAGLLPSLSLSGNYAYNWEEVENRDKGTNSDWDFESYGATLSLSQPLFRRQNWLEYDQSRLQVSQAEMAYAKAEQDLILRLAEAYFAVLEAQENLNAAEAYQGAVGAQLEVAKEAFKLGTGINTDVYDAETRLATALTQKIAAQTELDIRLRALQVITGEHLQPNTDSFPDALVSPPQPNNIEQWMQTAMTENLAVLQQSLVAEQARREIERQRAGHLPTVDLVLSTGRTSTLSSGDREVTDDSWVAVQFNLPLYQGGAISSRTREATAALVAEEAKLDDARRQAGLNASQSYLGVVNGLAQIAATRQGVEAAKSAVTSNKDAFDLGVRLSIDVLNAQNQVYFSQRDLNRLKVETLLAQLRLKAAVGALGDRDVQQLDLLFKAKPDA